MENDSANEPLTVRMPVAKRLTGLGETKLRELIKERKLKSVAIGRTRLIDYQSLKQLIGTP